MTLKSAAATAIGKSSKNSSLNIKRDRIIPLLMKLVNANKTFQNVVATGAINGLKEFSIDNDKGIIIDIADFLIENTKHNKEYFIRTTAVTALGKFLNTKNNNKNLKDINQKIFNQLLKLLKDKRRKIKINALHALADEEAKFTNIIDPRVIQSIDELIDVAEHDLDGFVRRHAERSLNVIRGWINEWSVKPQKIDIRLREIGK